MIQAKRFSHSLSWCANRDRSHTERWCLPLQRFAKEVHLSANHRLASPKSSSRLLRCSTPWGEPAVHPLQSRPASPTGRGSALWPCALTF